MANVKKARNKLLYVAAIVIIVIIGSYLGVNFSEILSENGIFPGESTEEQFIPGESVEGQFIVTMIDVGQADCFLLEQNGKTALIDCGTSSAADDVIEYLKQKGITRLDYVMGTHPHDDHMGGMYKIITNFEIGTIIIPEITKMQITTAWYGKLMKEIKDGIYDEKNPEKEVRYILDYPEVGEIYTLGEAELKVIGPIEEPKNNANNYSIVLKVSFGTQDIIMTGDAETQVEKAILATGTNLDAEILKAGHHGSDTSTSDEFLDAISPEYVLISAGFGNKHEHPIKSIMEKLEKRNLEVYRTDESGTVVITITSDSIEFSVEPGDYLSGVELEASKTK